MTQKEESSAGSEIPEMLYSKANQMMANGYIWCNVGYFTSPQLYTFTSRIRRYIQNVFKKILYNFRQRTYERTHSQKISHKRTIEGGKINPRKILGIEPTIQPREPGPVRNYNRCYMCERKRDRKIKTRYHQCDHHVSKDHTKMFTKRIPHSERQ